MYEDDIEYATITIDGTFTSISSPWSAGYGVTDYGIIVEGIQFPYNIISINSYSMDSFSVNNIVLPSSLKIIGERAFAYCCNLTSLELPKSIETIGKYAFYGCQNLKHATIKNDTISEGQFEDCTNLESVILNDNFKVIDSYAFFGCKNLKSLTIPDSITCIGQSAFYNCSQLWTSFSIPPFVTTLGAYAFDGTVRTIYTNRTYAEIAKWGTFPRWWGNMSGIYNCYMYRYYFSRTRRLFSYYKLRSDFYDKDNQINSQHRSY